MMWIVNFLEVITGDFIVTAMKLKFHKNNKIFSLWNTNIAKFVILDLKYYIRSSKTCCWLFHRKLSYLIYFPLLWDINILNMVDRTSPNGDSTFFKIAHLLISQMYFIVCWFLSSSMDWIGLENLFTKPSNKKCWSEIASCGW